MTPRNFGLGYELVFAVEKGDCFVQVRAVHVEYRVDGLGLAECGLPVVCPEK